MKFNKVIVFALFALIALTLASNSLRRRRIRSKFHGKKIKVLKK
jgi:hypothetical protein